MLLEIKTSLRENWRVIIVSIAAYFAQYIFFVYLAQVLLPADFGDLSIAFSLAVLLSKIADLGGTQTLASLLPKFRHENNSSASSGILLFFMLATVATGIVLALTTNILAYLDIELLKNIGFDEYHPLNLALWMMPLFCLMSLSSSLLKSYNYLYWAIIPNKIATFVLGIIFVWLQSTLGFSLTDWNTILVLAMSYFLVLISQQAAIFKLIPKKFISSSPSFNISSWLKISLPLMASSFGFSLLNQSDLMMIEMLGADEQSVGFFSSALKTSSIIFLLMNSLDLVFAPLFSRSLQNEPDSLQKLISTLNKFNFIFCLPIFIILIIFGKNILAIFGPGYVLAYPSLVLLSLSLLISATFGSILIILRFYDLGKNLIIFQLISLTIDICLNILLIPTIGITGCAAARLASIVFSVMSFYFVSYNKLKLKPF